jgi:membrane complex biogenesis BtpA family protein
MTVLERVFGVPKPVIAMVHLPALPGRPRHDRSSTIDGLTNAVGEDVAKLQEAGVDGLLFCNEADIPYSLAVGHEISTSMASMIGSLRRDVRLPYGVNILWDARATVALARATDATFAREVFVGVYESDLGIIAPAIGEIASFRDQIGASGVALFTNITPEFSSALGRRTVGERAAGAAFLGLDAILISGPTAGVAFQMDDLRAAKAGAPRTPVLANTGVRAETVRDVLAIADGVIVGTALKRDGGTWNPVDSARARRFMDEADAARHAVGTV